MSERAQPDKKGDSDVQEPDDLEGKTIAINTLNNISQLTVTAALDSEGVDTSTINFVEVPPPDVVGQLEAGQIDAAGLVEPFVTTGRNAGQRMIIHDRVATEPAMTIATQRAMLEARGDDAEHQHLRYIRQINAALAGRPEGLRVTTHLCRGNYQSSWAAEGSYDFVAEALFGELAVDGFFLEYDDARSGGFEPLRFVPPDKNVVLGLITTKRPELESEDTLKRRIDEAARYVDLDQLCLSPQCGFSSTVEGNKLSYDQQVAKLRLIVEVASEVSG